MQSGHSHAVNRGVGSPSTFMHEGSAQPGGGGYGQRDPLENIISLGSALAAIVGLSPPTPRTRSGVSLLQVEAGDAQTHARHKLDHPLRPKQRAVGARGGVQARHVALKVEPKVVEPSPDGLG